MASSLVLGSVPQEEMNELQSSFFERLQREPDVPVAVLAIEALTSAIAASSATTIMGLNDEIKEASRELVAVGGGSIALSSACALFARFATRTSLDLPDISECKAKIVGRGTAFAERASQARTRIAELGTEFIRDGAVILTHSYSRVVAAVLLAAARQAKLFSVIVTESRPDTSGHLLAAKLRAEGIPVTLILDAAVGKVMEQVDMVITGAEGVVESGGIINKIGSYPMAIVANCFNKPFYVATESFKFARLYPLDQDDYPCAQFSLEESSVEDPSAPGTLLTRSRIVPDGDEPEVTPLSVSSVDYTPPKFITLLITDLGNLTPSAVSDELIKLYY
ncbi:translation initiation factor eIF-2B subunit alpha [Thecamonas trahens ATCC 50062]|uniref:Translation initiation factor eIF2B subunit alpha n=1 Tax=Thecamonas trahens ATCC 50062 TaxID=461836 RepID=A0A0L0D8G8_THETB|nr:translation initiation factor eIF-2B subunit alpha [Thecamonas trahens ATCC 50062]KNC48667.1 translation initiation factor eIF-2B subunit alpha [Thecamonas trahens ATCC 50062]|eukprot:XP_013762723.1 translation initiation factor eIF-2B subunit alpha [Thecamonas trahens ATCC 50062]